MHQSLLICTAFAAAVSLAQGVEPAARLGEIIEVCVHIAADVPTADPDGGSAVLRPSHIVEYESEDSSYTFQLAVPGEPALGGIHKLDQYGAWLFTVEAPSDLGGALPTAAQPRDIVRRDGGGSFALFFCGASVNGVVPATSQIDSVFMEGGDGGDLVLSFDVPTTIGAQAFDPSDLVRYTNLAGSACSAWQLAAGNPVFDASAAGSGIPRSRNTIGATVYAGLTIFSFDVPTTLSPVTGSGSATFVPGDIVGWDGASFSLVEHLENWPISSEVHGLSGPGNPGSMGGSVRLRKSAVPGNVVVQWGQSCSEGAEDAAIYEGAVGGWSTHLRKTCTDAGGDRSEEITPEAGNRYFLVVPLNAQGEGSYGTRSNGMERPPASDACHPHQLVTACPS